MGINCSRKHEKTSSLNSKHKHFILINISHPLFHQSVTPLTTVKLVKLSFDQIRTMTCVSRSGFPISLLFLGLFVCSQTLAKPGNNAAVTKQYNVNVYNGCSAGPEKKIETILQEMKKQLTQLQDDINILKGNKTTVKGKNGICVQT